MEMGFSIALGYRSGFLPNQQHRIGKNDWELLCDVIESVRSEPEVYSHGVMLFASKEVQEHPDLMGFAKAISLKIGEVDDEKYWYIPCSGGGMSRTIRESLAVAFCNRVQIEMAGLGLHVNITTY